MTPFKVKNAYITVAPAMSLEPDDVKAINQFYWKYVRNKLSNLVNPIIFIAGLGTMELKHWKIDSTIDKLTKKLNRWSDTTNGSAVYDVYKGDLDKVTGVRNMLNQQAERLIETKQRKKEYADKRTETMES